MQNNEQKFKKKKLKCNQKKNFLPEKHHLPVTLAKMKMNTTKMRIKIAAIIPTIAPMPKSKPEIKFVRKKNNFVSRNRK